MVTTAIGDKLPYNLTSVEVSVDSRGCVTMADYYAHDMPRFYVSLADEYIAAMLVRMNTSAYVYNTLPTVRYGNTNITPDTLADVVQESFNQMYKGKRGRKPNIAFYVIDGNDGTVIRVVTP